MTERDLQASQDASLHRRKSDDTGRAVNVRVLGAVAVILAVVFAIVAFVTLRFVNDASNQLQSDNARYSACEEATTNLQIASDYLTTQCRLYVTTGYISNMKNYTDEVLVTDRRGEAVATLEANLSGEALVELSAALDLSNNLVTTELHAMRLAAAAYGDEDLPSMIAEVDLPQSELTLDNNAKLETAKRLVLGSSYEHAKQQISDRVNASADEILRDLEVTSEQSNERLNRLIAALQLVVVLLVCMVLAVVIVAFMFVLRPIRSYVNRIHQGKELIPGGAFELHYLADAYNEMYHENMKRLNYFRRAAEHDALTGLGNRGAYDDFLAGQTQDYALMLLDVDYFKVFNDTYGHTVGDEVLKKVASSIAVSFRATDFPCRIGGDEFAVIMTDVKPELREVITRKIEQVTSALADTSDGLPPVTLSIGVAFSSDVTEELDIFNAADNALYVVKERGRNGYAFYGDK